MNNTTVSTEIKERVDAKLVECIALAQQKYGIMFEFPTVVYKRLGTKAGVAFALENRIELNQDYFHNGHLEDMINQTAPHELAHIITRKVFGRQVKNGRRTAHGPDWKNVMRNCFRLDPDRCHEYSTEGVKLRNALTFEYTCAGGHSISVGKNVHHKIQSGKEYKCKKCKGKVWYKDGPKPENVQPSQVNFKNYIDDIMNIPMPKIIA